MSENSFSNRIDNGAILLGSRLLPTIAQDPSHRMFVVPLENGWNAFVVAFPRPDETEYSVATVTREEAHRIANGEWGLLGITDNTRRRFEYPRGDTDLLDTLLDISTDPSPSPSLEAPLPWWSSSGDTATSFHEADPFVAYPEHGSDGGPDA